MLQQSNTIYRKFRLKKTKPTLIAKDGKNCYEKEKLSLK
jgi:hypothetical protein